MIPLDDIPEMFDSLWAACWPQDSMLLIGRLADKGKAHKTFAMLPSCHSYAVLVQLLVCPQDICPQSSELGMEVMLYCVCCVEHFVPDPTQHTVSK